MESLLHHRIHRAPLPTHLVQYDAISFDTPPHVGFRVVEIPLDRATGCWCRKCTRRFRVLCTGDDGVEDDGDDAGERPSPGRLFFKTDAGNGVRAGRRPFRPGVLPAVRASRRATISGGVGGAEETVAERRGEVAGRRGEVAERGVRGERGEEDSLRKRGPRRVVGGVVVDVDVDVEGVGDGRVGGDCALLRVMRRPDRRGRGAFLDLAAMCGQRVEKSRTLSNKFRNKECASDQRWMKNARGTGILFCRSPRNDPRMTLFP